jgi:putative transposase
LIAFLEERQYLTFDRNTKFCASFRKMISEFGVKLLRLPPLSPNLNACAERFVRTIKEESISRLILFDKRSLYGVLRGIFHSL